MACVAPEHREILVSRFDYPVFVLAPVFNALKSQDEELATTQYRGHLTVEGNVIYR